MPKARELTDVEKFYIENNLGKSNEQLASQMSGIGARTVLKYRESIQNKNEEVDTDHTTETRQERIDRLGNGPKSGEFISRRDGVSIMTQQSSEVSDARKIVKGSPMSSKEFQEINKDKIHKPQN